MGVFTGDPGARPTNAATDVPTPSIGFDPEETGRRRLFLVATTTATAPAPRSTKRVVRVMRRA
jgi:hypothetical protein